jgi:hypothetical protein
MVTVNRRGVPTPIGTPGTTASLIVIRLAGRRYGVKIWEPIDNQAVAIRADPGRDLQRQDQRAGVWKHVGIGLSLHFEHGADDGSRVALHMTAAVLFQPVLMGKPRQNSLPAL